MNRTLVALLASLTMSAVGCSAETSGGPPTGDPNGDDGKGDVGNQDPNGDPNQDPGDDPSQDPGNDPGHDPGVDPGVDPVAGAESEPNDDAGTANAVSMPSSIAASLTAGDKDYFSVALQAGDAAEIETVVAAPPEGVEGATFVDTVIEIYAPGGAEPMMTNDDGGQNRGSLAHFTASAPGSYVVLVRGFSDTTEGSYTLEVRAGIPDVLPSGSESEPNDSSGQATAVGALPAALTATLEAAGSDWFSFQAAGAGAFVLETGAVDGAGATDTVIEAFSSDGSTSLGSDDDGAEAALFSRLELDVPAAGTYYVQVRGYGESTTGEYVIRISPRGGAGAQ